jgi:hypothetical protein
MVKKSAELNRIRPFVYSDLIRVGNRGDGGYVLPECVLDDIKILVSFGIGYNHTFEYDVQNRVRDIKIVGFDHTVSSFYFFSKSVNGGFKLLLNIGNFEDLKKRFLRFLNFLNFWTVNPKNRHFKTCIKPSNINKILNQYKNEKILLKIDIEGGEWDSLPIVAKGLSNVNCLIIEFHDISKNISGFNELLSDLKATFNIAHTHINNFSNLNYKILPDFIEITFVNKKFVHKKKKVDKLPNKFLDVKTMPNKTDFKIVFN